MERINRTAEKLTQSFLRLDMKENSSYALIQNTIKGSYPGLRLGHKHFVLEIKEANVIKVAKKKSQT